MFFNCKKKCTLCSLSEGVHVLAFGEQSDILTPPLCFRKDRWSTLCSLSEGVHYVAGNQLADIDAEKIGMALRNNMSLSCLDLSYNHFGEKGGVFLGQGMVSKKSKKCSKHKQQNSPYSSQCISTYILQSSSGVK